MEEIIPITLGNIKCYLEYAIPLSGLNGPTERRLRVTGRTDEQADFACSILV
jgi:hypothetical protein